VVGERGVPPSVATIVLFSAPASERTIAAAAPATASTRKSSTGQIQSPGYQANRRCQAFASLPKAPLPADSRYPHSRQYS
jgi:hypothetical protein